LETFSEGAEAIILASTTGIGALRASLPASKNAGCHPSGPLVTLQNATASQGPTEGGAAAIFSLGLAPNSTCWVQFDGSSYNTPGPAHVAITLMNLLLEPKD
jgi:hypothetical protein